MRGKRDLKIPEETTFIELYIFYMMAAVMEFVDATGSHFLCCNVRNGPSGMVSLIHFECLSNMIAHDARISSIPNSIQM